MKVFQEKLRKICTKKKVSMSAVHIKIYPYFFEILIVLWCRLETSIPKQRNSLQVDFRPSRILKMKNPSLADLAYYSVFTHTRTETTKKSASHHIILPFTTLSHRRELRIKQISAPYQTVLIPPPPPSLSPHLRPHPIPLSLAAPSA